MLHDRPQVIKEQTIKASQIKKQGQYRNLILEGGTWQFEVLTKTRGWVPLGGLSADTPKADAETFAQNTANGWIKQ